MTSMSRQFVEKSQGVTSFDYDRNAYPDPSEVEDLLQWFDRNITRFDNIPSSSFLMTSVLSNADFGDGSAISIRTNIINDEIQLTTGHYKNPDKKPLVLLMYRTCRPAYDYFNIMTRKQAQREERIPPYY